MKIRGKKLTVAQKKILTNNGIDTPDDYLYTKTEQIDIRGNGKHLDQKLPKIEKIVVINRVTGETKRFNVEG